MRHTKIKAGQKPGPRLQALLDAGTVTIIRGYGDGDYIAKASDGTAVALGSVGHSENYIESYLKDHPTPDTW